MARFFPKVLGSSDGSYFSQPELNTIPEIELKYANTIRPAPSRGWSDRTVVEGTASTLVKTQSSGLADHAVSKGLSREQVREIPMSLASENCQCV